MRIKKVRIKNSRSIIDSGEISLDNKITILLGKNEQGKTNFLKALESFGREYKYVDNDLTYLISRETDTLPVVTIWFGLNEEEKEILSFMHEDFKNCNELIITKYSDGHYEIQKPDLNKINSKFRSIKQSILNILKDSEIKINKSFDFLNKLDKNKHINWLKSLQRPDGGLSHIPGQASHITHTYYAVKTLMELGTLNQINKDNLIKFILSCEHLNGGFGHLPNQQPQAQYTYNAIMLLKDLKELNKLDKNKQINWLKSLQGPDGGFSHIPGKASHITHTYYAVKTLMELGALNQINKDNLIKFILSCEHLNGGFGHLPNQQPQAQFTYNAIMLLKELKAYFIEIFGKYFQELKKTSDIVKIDKLVNNILSILLDENLVNLIKRESEKLKDLTKNDLSKKILDMLPSFVYFDTINIIEDDISLSEYLKNKEKYRTFKNLFELTGLDVEKVENTPDPHGRKLLFRNASTDITGMINNFWKQEKVTVNLDIDGDRILIFIEDELGAKADPPSRRSDGFRWFLSFYINFMSETKGELKNAILLLDNPGWVLHPSGQKNLLEILEEITKTNQIIIATHSPFLIDKNKLERIRIIERKEGVGTKVLEKFWDSIYDSLYVIRASIGADISDSLFGHKNNIIVEGFSDKVYLETLSNYLREKGKKLIDLRKVMIIGAGGADKIPYLLAWHKAEKYNALALVDSDNEGRKVVQEIQNRNMDVDADSDILMLNEISEEFKGKDLEIEELLSEKFYHMAVNRAYKEIFENKLGKPEIELDEIPTNGLRTKCYSKFFKSKNLGGFDKIKVALEIKKILSRKISNDTENILGDTIDRFEKLFEKINKKFQKKEIEL